MNDLNFESMTSCFSFDSPREEKNEFISLGLTESSESAANLHRVLPSFLLPFPLQSPPKIKLFEK